MATVVACGEPATSEIVEFCIPIESGVGNTPVARTVLEYERFSTTSRPQVSDTLSFLIATESPLSAIDTIHHPDGTVLDASTVDLPRISLAITDASSDDPIASRAAFWKVDALALQLPPLGPAGLAETYDGIIGGDLLRRYAVRLTFLPDAICTASLPWLPEGETPVFPSITFFNERPDSDSDLADDGFSVFAYKLAGGGSTIIADQEHQFGKTRVAVGACVEPDRYEPSSLNGPGDIQVSGVDAFALIATGTQPLVMSRTFFDRLQATKQRTDPGWPASGISATTLSLPEGVVTASRFDTLRMVLVGNVESGEGPCVELARRRRVDFALRRNIVPADLDELRNPAAAVVEIDESYRSDGGGGPLLPSYVVSDTSALFSGLQIEVGNDIPTIDLLLGTAFLAKFELLVDYPADRVVMRCLDYQFPVENPDPNPPAGEELLCPSDSELTSARKSCCEPGGVCRCGFSACCQYYRYTRPN